MLIIPFENKNYYIEKELLISFFNQFNSQSLSNLFRKENVDPRKEVENLTNSKKAVALLKKLKLYDEVFLKDLPKIKR